MRRILFMLITGLGIIAGCTNMAPEMPAEADCTPKFPDMDVTYENYVKGILTEYCIGCHNGGSAPGNFTTYAGIQPYVETSFYFRVVQDGADMPRGNAPLPRAIRDSLNVWLENCAPQN